MKGTGHFVRRELFGALFAAVALVCNTAAIALADASAIEIDGPPEFVQDMQAALFQLEFIRLRTYVETYVWRIEPSSGAGWPADAGGAVVYPPDRFQRALVQVRWPMDGLNDPSTVAALLAHEATHARLNQVDPANRGDETATRSVQLLVLWELAGPLPAQWQP